ncbi:MAG TPA: NUDIX hydrolase [Candidatus Acidoferrum sp.]|jgi:ADP-ribose pyrophosphatase|nr:NUDIX hydrolase [Candidatus Acidoferrum sp.]
MSGKKAKKVGGQKALKASSGANAKAKTLSSRIVFKGKVFSVRRDEIIEPSGVRATRDMIAHPGSVVVMPIQDDGKIVVIRQYRYAARQYLWELVAGRIDAGENPKQAAKRELIEETGLRAKNFRVFLEFWPSPGFLEEKMFVLLAEGVTQGVAEPEEDERIEAKAFTRAEIEKMLQNGEFHDGKSISSLLYYLRFMV